LSNRLCFVLYHATLRLVDFGSKDGNLSRGLDSDFDDIAVNPGDFDEDVIADYDSFLRSSRQN
jgi:hypothetical protein